MLCSLCSLEPTGRLTGGLLARSVLYALQRAAVVFYSTAQIRGEIIQRGLFDVSKLVHAPYGVASEFGPLSSGIPDQNRYLPQGHFILNVGSAAPRKRLELLFRAFAVARAEDPTLILVQQGAKLTGAQTSLLQQLSIRNAVLTLPKIFHSGQTGTCRSLPPPRFSSGFCRASAEGVRTSAYW